MSSRENFSDCLFTLTNILVQKLWPFDNDEIGSNCVGNGFGHHRFTTAWRSIEQNPTTLHFKVEILEFLLLGHRQKYFP